MPTAEATRAEARFSVEALAYAGLVLTSIAWALAFIAGKVTMREFTPLPAAALRYLTATSVLLPLAWRDRHRPVQWRGVAAPLLIMTLCGGLLYQWLFLAALQRTSATNASLLIALNPVFTLLFSPFGGERIERGAVFGVILALLGATTITLGGQWQGALGLTEGWNTGDLLALAAAVAWATFNVASRRVVGKLSGAQINLIVYGSGGVILFVMSQGEAPLQQLAHASWAAIGGIVTMALLASVGAGLFFLHGVRIVGVSRTVIFVYLVPVMTAALSALFLGEPILISQVIGGTFVLAGLYCASRPA